MNEAGDNLEELYDELDGDTLNEQYIAAERDYYFAKAKVDVLTEVVKETKNAAKAAQAKVDEARLGG
jgi:hypothetical protein